MPFAFAAGGCPCKLALTHAQESRALGKILLQVARDTGCFAVTLGNIEYLVTRLFCHCSRQRCTSA
ncbi:MAG: hypothetical protein IKS78_01740, partial [Clostridia bacterium]|nr:hypothetical protein [Clostridia bacterium]